MDLTPEHKAHIDSISHYSLLYKWRFAPAGDPWFQGETGIYWGKRMAEKREENPGEAVSNSKSLEW